LLVALHHRLTTEDVAGDKEAYSMRSTAGVRPYTIAVAIAWRASNGGVWVVCRNVSFRERTYVDTRRGSYCPVVITEEPRLNAYVHISAAPRKFVLRKSTVATKAFLGEKPLTLAYPGHAFPRDETVGRIGITPVAKLTGGHISVVFSVTWMLVAPRNWRVSEANQRISLLLHEMEQVLEHVSTAEHVGVETDNIGRFGCLDCLLTRTEEAREVLAQDGDLAFFDTADWEHRSKLSKDVTVGVVTNHYFTRPVDGFEFLETRAHCYA
jgi:hypothetical protein